MVNDDENTFCADPAPAHKFRCRLYANIDAASELVVTATPDDRSNSPPIINNATAHAIIPIVELAYNTVANASGERNGGATIKKNTKIATAPIAAPISGRINKRCTRLRSFTRSS